MLPILLFMAASVESFSYAITPVSDRSKPVASAPVDYEPIWKEHVETIEAKSPKDSAFSRFMRERALRLRREYYDGETFETYDSAGSLEVNEYVLAASPDLVSASIGSSFYISGMPHPNTQGDEYVNWSRRLHRPLRQKDVLCRTPDRALRRLAQSRFDNPEGLQNASDTDGIPLAWDHASIGPEGITWSFDPYELGGYLSAGGATIRWRSLKPYLCRRLPFVIGAIRKAPPSQ
jgi:hypothetical protein